MFDIHSYDRIGKWRLNKQRAVLLGLPEQNYQTQLMNTEVEIEYVDNLITVEFCNHIAKFIGVHIALNPFHENFFFASKNQQQVIEYFSLFGKEVYVENETMVISVDMGITVYFEDGIKEVGIFSTDYIEKMIDGLDRLC